MLQPFALKSRSRPVTKNLGQKVELAMVNHLIKTHKKHGIILNEEAKRLSGSGGSAGKGPAQKEMVDSGDPETSRSR